jgi:2-polyprenyl-3-methyl-5-hydroxy-6-metoxy-1,4-benzoquinol methylase
MSLLRRAWRAFDNVVLWRVRRKRDELVWRSPALAERMFRGAVRLARLPWRDETANLPEPLSVRGVTIDVVSDLVAYTDLARADVERELTSRAETSFRTEWYATPPELRRDHWFYLSSKGYLFGNAIHFADRSFPDRFVTPYVPEDGSVLDFGAGTGNLALLMASGGIRVHATELSALQRDFMRFRVARYGLERLLTVCDWWDELPSRRFDVIVAVDVLEHLPDCQRELEERLLPTLAPKGVLVENSPFVVNTSNPMHHEDFGLEPFLRDWGFELVMDGGENTRVWRREYSSATSRPARHG